ncbi:MAG: Thioredoxin reductase [uncultured Lysobacter sp.]|uniref:Thioredoxin reductase n=1 Tax=uncultured Lysobacter sp. TaxID=271060 RepID=A0A6J4M7Q1_9GAMM|nr:MAG: Thioredoxin reductase [uncultured Lysobacter sp.]
MDNTATADAPNLDCLIIGGGPAGLTAATYLMRFHRRILVVDAGSSRARWIPTSHNCPGFPSGVHGTTLLERMREQAMGYGTPIVSGCVARLEKQDEGFVATAADGQRWRARFVILATGVVDRMPALRGLEDAIASSAVRLCAICDAYEASDDSIAVYGPIDDAVRHALFLRTFSPRVSALPLDGSAPDPELAQQARDAGVTLCPVPCTMRYEPAGETADAADGVVVEFEDGSTTRFTTLYPVLGSEAQTAIATALGARCDDNAELIVDAHQQTSVDGLYAAGDLVSALNQIAVAVGHASIAATAIHNRLPRNFRERRETQPPTAPDLPTPAR